MSIRSPIQLDQQTKLDLEALKERTDFRACKTHSDVVERLIRFFHTAQRQQEERVEAAKSEKERKQAEDVHLGAELKKSFKQIGEEIGIRSESDIALVLIDHYNTSLQVSMSTFTMLGKLRK